MLRFARLGRGRQWGDAVSAACVAFLALLCTGAALVLAAKLQYPDLGAGSSLLSVTKAIVMISLACLGTPLEFGGVEVAAVPLGALVAAGSAIAWSAGYLVTNARTEATARWHIGARVALVFAVVCALAAVIFRFRGGGSPASVDATSAGVLALVWGSLFGTAGAFLAGRSWRDAVGELNEVLSVRSRGLAEAVAAGVIMLGVALAAAALAGLVWVIVGLASGAPSASFGPADAAAAVLYLAAFGANVVVAIVALSLGAVLEIGTQITIGGRAIGTIREFSLWEWGRGDPPWYAYLAVLIPVAACFLGGFVGRRRASPDSAPMAVVGGGALLFAFSLGVLATLADARLGAGLVRDRGFGRIAADPGTAFVLALAWGLVLGYVGWRAAGRQVEAAEAVTHAGAESP